MTDRTTTPAHGLDDDALRARLAATDPVAGATVPAQDVTLLVEDVLARDASEPAAPSRGRRIALVAGGLVAAAAVASALVLPSVLGDDDVPAGTDVLTVAAPPAQDAASASCVTVEAQFLDDFPVAFAGTVVSTDDDGSQATLDVDRWYAGGDADQVRVDGLDPDLVANGYAVAFSPGTRYLVAVNDSGTVVACGFTGPADPALQAVYDEAFGG